MAYKLKDGVFKVGCKAAGCPFASEFKVTQNIMGLTETDVQREAQKIAHDMAQIKHDAIYGRQHSLTKPVIRKVRGSYVSIGGKGSSEAGRQNEAVVERRFDKGEIIVKKGGTASTICQIVKGSACPTGNERFVYSPGDTFGVAALLTGHTRMVDIVAAKANTVVAFYNLRELNAKDPQRARDLYNAALQDVFHVLTMMEQKIAKLQSTETRQKKRITDLEATLGGSKK